MFQKPREVRIGYEGGFTIGGVQDHAQGCHHDCDQMPTPDGPHPPPERGGGDHSARQKAAIKYQCTNEAGQKIKSLCRRNVAEEAIQPLLCHRPLREAHEEGVVDHHHYQHDATQKIKRDPSSTDGRCLVGHVGHVSHGFPFFHSGIRTSL
jgi:hypothetical protein